MKNLLIIASIFSTITIVLSINNESIIRNIPSSSVLYDILKISSNKHDLNQKCRDDMKMFKNDLNENKVWAVKGKEIVADSLTETKTKKTNLHNLTAIDSSARIQSEFLYGNNYWLGSSVECATLQSPFTITMDNRFPRIMKSDLLNATAPFDIGYRIVYARHNSPLQVEVEFQLSSVKNFINFIKQQN